MRVPVSWLREFVDAGELDPVACAESLTAAGLKVEAVEMVGGDVDNVVVAEVLQIEELTGFKKPIRYCQLTDGTAERWVICGATNFAVGARVAYARPPARLPGGVIEARAAYGRSSDGMICSAAELGLSDDHTGILVLEGDPPLGADVVEALRLRDAVLDVAVNPDRGYALSVRGVARELATALRVAYRDPAAVPAPPAAAGGYPVRVEDTDGCTRYVARTVRGLDPSAPSPVWLQRRLTLAGMRPISLAVDVTNHVMLEVGAPLHAFDAAALAGDIVVRRARAGETLVTLDGVTRQLHQDDVVITDDSGPVALAGVMGGGPTEVTAGTTALVIEAARFDPVAIAYTSRRHRLASEASRRFERGVDDTLQPAAAELAIRLLVELGGGQADPGITDIDHRPPRPVITFDPALPARVAGLDYPLDAVRSRLADVGCEVTGEASGEGRWAVTPPPWRGDLTTPVDLVEEVVRLEGYGRLPALVATAPPGRGLTREQRLRRQVGRVLAARGFVEVITDPFVAAADDGRLRLPGDDPRRATVRVANPVSDEQPLLRGSLLPGLLAAAARNIHRGAGDPTLFESGRVFRARPAAAAAPRPPVTRRPTDAEYAAMESALPPQPYHLAGVLAGEWERSGWWGEGRPAVWADAVEAVRTVAEALGVRVQLAAADAAPWHPGRCAAISVTPGLLGWAGELHPRVVEAYRLPARACAFEVALGPLFAAVADDIPGPAVSAFPAATLDVALVVDAAVPVAAVTAALQEGAGPLLESLRLFDVFTGPQVGEGRRSLAYSLRLRSPERTLSTEEAVAVRDAAVAAAGRRTGAVLRG